MTFAVKILVLQTHIEYMMHLIIRYFILKLFPRVYLKMLLIAIFFELLEHIIIIFLLFYILIV